jgi:hypothetical protein
MFDRVNLKHGVPEDGRTTTCTAGAGSLLLEFILLSRLTGGHRLSRILIFTHPGSRIPDPKTATKKRGEKN